MGRETRAPARRLDDLDVERIDLRVRRTASQRELHAIDRFLVSLDQRFDAPVGQVARVAGDPFPRGAIRREHPEADALHAPADQKPPRHDSHGKTTIIVRGFDTVGRMPRIGSSSHGESKLRMLRVVRRGDRHDPKELGVSVRFEGAFAAAFREGRADGLLPGETLKNIVHRAARDCGTGEIEEFGLALTERVLGLHPAMTRARVEVTESQWVRLDVSGRPQGQAFMAGTPEVKTAAITSNGRQRSVVSGLAGLTMMRTAGFAPRPKDAPDDGATDGLPRLLVAELSAKWSYSSPDVTFRTYREGVRALIVETFARHASRSVQQTLYAMADLVLASYQEIADVTLTLHERPYRPADLFSAGVDTANGLDDLFVSIEEPVGIVEVTVERDS
jgi:urate oxidase